MPETSSAVAFMDKMDTIINADFSEDEERGEEKKKEEEKNLKKEEENKKKKRKKQKAAIPFIQTVESMRQVLLEFMKGEEENFSKDEASAMRIYFQWQLNLSSKVSLNKITPNSVCNKYVKGYGVICRLFNRHKTGC